MCHPARVRVRRSRLEKVLPQRRAGADQKKLDHEVEEGEGQEMVRAGRKRIPKPHAAAVQYVMEPNVRSSDEMRTHGRVPASHGCQRNAELRHLMRHEASGSRYLQPEPHLAYLVRREVDPRVVTLIDRDPFRRDG